MKHGLCRIVLIGSLTDRTARIAGIAATLIRRLPQKVMVAFILDWTIAVNFAAELDLILITVTGKRNPLEASSASRGFLFPVSWQTGYHVLWVRNLK